MVTRHHGPPRKSNDSRHIRVLQRQAELKPVWYELNTKTHFSSLLKSSGINAHNRSVRYKSGV